jgi:hypothetical protein
MQQQSKPQQGHPHIQESEKLVGSEFLEFVVYVY